MLSCSVKSAQCPVLCALEVFRVFNSGEIGGLVAVRLTHVREFSKNLVSLEPPDAASERKEYLGSSFLRTHLLTRSSFSMRLFFSYSKVWGDC